MQNKPQVSVEKYFRSRAENYHQKSLAWPWSIVRHNEAKAIEVALAPLKGLRTLDLGCGAGYYTRKMLSKGAVHVFAVDTVETMVSQLPVQSVTGIVSDVLELKLEKNFDKILSAGMLEFVEDPQAVLAKVKDWARDDTDFVILFPRSNKWGKLYKRFHLFHNFKVRLFSIIEMEDMANKAGWVVTSSRFVWPFAQVMSFRLRSY